MSKLKLNRRETIGAAGAALTAQAIFVPLPNALAGELKIKRDGLCDASRIKTRAADRRRPA